VRPEAGVGLSSGLSFTRRQLLHNADNAITLHSVGWRAHTGHQGNFT
jgi:hypothetical protein